MSTTANIITVEGGNFSIMPNELLNDSQISLTAKGLYIFMRGKPAGWNFTIRSMAKQLKEGETALKSAMKELKTHGWMTYSKHSDGTGAYHLYWSALAVDEPKAEKPHVDFPKKGKSTRISKTEPVVRNIGSNPHSPPEGECVGAEKQDSKTKRATAQQVADAYNEILGSKLPKCAVLNDKRKRAIKRFLDDLKTPTVKAVRAYLNRFAKVARPFHFGENDRHWRADFDYVIKADTVIKVREESL